MLHQDSLRRAFAATFVVLLPAVAAAQAPARWTVDPKTSIAWWQVNPHLNHLWATTCPEEPSWRPGEGRSSGWTITNYSPSLPSTGYGNTSDTVHVPLYPRHRVRPLCQEVVQGSIVVNDVAHWTGVHGVITILGNGLVTGESMRDVTMHQMLNTSQYPNITFTLDSFVNVTKQGDTLTGNAFGSLAVRGVTLASPAIVKAFPDAGGMRVLAKVRMDANNLRQYTPRLIAMGLGLSGLWKDLFVGADLILRPAEAATGDMSRPPHDTTTRAGVGGASTGRDATGLP